MSFLHGVVDARAGDVVEVTLVGNAANVMLLDADNFRRYKAGQGFNYYGGHFTSSPVRIAAPSGGRWNVVVDLGGRPGRVNATIRLIAH